jgi:hypothetical protein
MRFVLAEMAIIDSVNVCRALGICVKTLAPSLLERPSTAVNRGRKQR